jgi:hypothetical protein
VPQLHANQLGLTDSELAVAISPNKAWIALARQEKNADDDVNNEYVLYLWDLSRRGAPQRLGSVPRVNSSPRVAFADNRYVILGGEDTKIWSLDNLKATPALIDGEFIGVTQSYSGPSSYLVITNRILPMMNTGEEFIATWSLSGQPAQAQMTHLLPHLGSIVNAPVELAGDGWLILYSISDGMSLYPLRKEFFPWLTMHLRQATEATLLPRHRRRYLGLDLPGDATQ